MLYDIKNALEKGTKLLQDGLEEYNDEYLDSVNEAMILLLQAEKILRKCD